MSSLGLVEKSNARMPDDLPTPSLVELIKATTNAIEERGNDRESAPRLNDVEKAKRSELLHAARSLVTSLESPEVALLEIAKGPAAHAVLRTAFKLNLFELVGRQEPFSVEKLALLTGVDKLLAVRIMRTLISIGIFCEVGDSTYSHNARSLALTNPAFRTFVSGLETTTMMTSLPSFLSSLSYSNPSDRHNALFQYTTNTHLNLFEWMQEHPEQLARYSATMSAATELQAPHLEATLISFLSRIPQPSSTSQDTEEQAEQVLLIDVGGGRGEVLPSVRAKLPNLKGRIIVQDLPKEIEGRKHVDGVEAMAYDFFTMQPVCGAHIYFFTHILHDWPDESCRQILLNTIPALTPHSKIVIVDIVVPETGAQPFTCMMDISMMAYGGCERTEKQWRALLGSVGLRIVGVEGPREGSLTGDSVLEVVCGEGSGDGEV